MKALSLFGQYRGLRKENYILFIGRIVTNLGAMIWPILTLVLSQKLGYDAKTIAIFMIVSGVVCLPAGLIGGKLADMINKKYIIVVCDFISIALYITCSFLPVGLISVILIIVGSTFQSAEIPAYDALVADLTLTKDRDKAYSLNYLGANIGLVASPTIAGLLFKDYLWLSFLISGLSLLVSTILIIFFLKDIKPVEETEEESEYQKSKEKDSIFKVLMNNKVILLFVVMMAIYWGIYTMWDYLMPLDIGNVHGENGALIYGTVTSVNCITVVMFTPLITYLFRKLSSTKKILIGIILVLVGYVVFLILLGWIPAYYISILLFTWGEIFCTIVSGGFITNRMPKTHRGRINGVMGVLQSIFSALIMYTVGYLYDEFGSTMSWIFVFIVEGVVIFLGLVLIFLDKKYYSKLYNNAQ